MLTIIIIGLIVLAVIGYFVDREIYFYEGSHLSPRIQSWLYDRWAKKYDVSKAESQKKDGEFLAQPLLGAVSGAPSAFVLDIATGTGRLPFALIQAGFKGHIIAVDISHGMLTNAAKKVEGHRDIVDFMKYGDFPLPFPSASFDVVVCLEALEVMQEMRTPIAEFARLLRPGGVLLTSRATEESGRKAKVVQMGEFKQLLENSGFEKVEITPWWKLFDRVFAVKAGGSKSVSYRVITDVLMCPNCSHQGFDDKQAGSLTCPNCDHKINVDDMGIIDYS